MKKALLALACIGASAGAASAQVEIGLKVSPSITSLRVDSPTQTGFQKNGSKVGFGGGIVVDYFFGQNYAFSTGLQLAGKGGKILFLDPTTSKRVEQKIGVQYLEIPVTVKLFTNDIATDTKLYFQLGGTVGGAIAAKIDGSKRYIDPTTSKESKALDHVITPDAAVLLGFGTEYQMGQSTKLFAGVSYHRGLLNVEKYYNKQRNFSEVSFKNSEVALDLGIKF
ncbi:Outer membrane protein beta-barrel domain-containing protein [Hymenobacter gelipurpurascens]|uniref:Outer membrane protein beta-barrel domain-containing protein n=1 Tax=Hymenobacter gelipurpurascens TaxID=89968 RepID=A0A212UH35_9BACT|nr:porin family protein [Hymenobacter gelipurpurascens]SNC77471.1 Outer membrane protein beta-barrel domain-containing protein [Hymenobacter gelipurpurascens]